MSAPLRSYVSTYLCRFVFSSFCLFFVYWYNIYLFVYQVPIDAILFWQNQASFFFSKSGFLYSANGTGLLVIIHFHDGLSRHGDGVGG